MKLSYYKLDQNQILMSDFWKYASVWWSDWPCRLAFNNTHTKCLQLCLNSLIYSHMLH